MQIVTLLFLIKDQQILLAMKKRGVGVGKWNGIGGKVDSLERIEVATVRECQEEVGVKPKNLTKVAEIDFRIPSQAFHNFCHVYTASEWEGEIVETEEMAPRWFTFEAIPYHAMWSDDIHWLPRVLAGDRVKAYFEFDESERVIRSRITDWE